MMRLTLSGNPFRDMALTSNLSAETLAATASGTVQVVPGEWPAGTLNFNVARADLAPLRRDGQKLPVALAGRVISDGKNVVIGNTKLKTWDLYPLNKTPLSLLLSERIDLGNQMVRDVNQEADLTTIVLGDRTIFGDSTITLMFDPKTFELRQWTITDMQKKDTSVMIFNVQNGVNLDPSVFEIPYAEVHGQKRGG